jgi:cytochrome b
MTDTGSTARLADGVSPPATVRVWDPLVRIFHWSLVGLFAFSYFTGDEWKSAHIWSGYAIAGLIAFRIVWGLVGSRHARFADFVRSPGTIAAYIVDTVRFRAKRYIGHNPAGGAMVVALLLMLSVIAASGYMMTTNAFWGVEWVSEVHETTVYLTIALIGLHVLGVVLASLEHRENLVLSMMTGRKRAP